MHISRRHAFMFAPALALAAAACSGQSGGVSVAQVKAYGNALAAAVAGAAQAYLAGPPMPSAAQAQIVNLVLADLKTAADALDGIPDGAGSYGTKDLVQQILTAVQKLTPIVAPFLGPAGVYVPLAIAVLQAFIASLPAPPATPAMPPAAMYVR